MGDTNYFIDIFNLKFAIKFAKMFLFVMIASLVYLVYAEWMRLQDTQMTMAMYTRIAGNYALTSSQDVDSLTSTDRSGYTMYEKGEYEAFLSALKKAVDDFGDPNLVYSYEVLKRSYDLADPSNLDGTLRYTPMSFNIPYLSYSMLTQCYNEAMQVMVANYNCHGSPSVLLCNGKLENLSNAVQPSCDIKTADSDYTYGKLNFSVLPLSGDLVRAIYGDEGFFNSKVAEVLGKLDDSLYEDPRVSHDSTGYTMSGNRVLAYDISFSTPYYYITGSRLLAFGQVTDTGAVRTANNGTPNTVIDTINSYPGLYCFSRGDNGKQQTDEKVYDIHDTTKNFYTSIQPRSGQLCFFVNKSDATSAYGTAHFLYTYLS